MISDEVSIREGPAPGDLGYIMYLHGDYYRREHGYGLVFESYVARAVQEFAASHDPDRDRVWLCEHRGRIVGSLLLMHRGPDTAQLRLFMVLPPYQGKGLGKRLMALFLDFLREGGYRSAYLWTTDEQKAAVELYKQYGFALAEQKDSTAFGRPLRELGLGIRDQTRLIVAGKLVSAFDICRMFSLGADGCNMARGFMFALGCIQAQTCHTGKCPTGVTTQDPGRYRALVVDDKYRRVANFHANTMFALKEAVESSGLQHPSALTPHHLMIRVNSREVRSAASQYLWLEPGDLNKSTVEHPAFAKYWDRARPDTFEFAA